MDCMALTSRIFILFSILIACCECQDFEEIAISTGKLRGIKKDGVTRYLGVPYAEPPVGPLRFRAPQPHKGWSGVRDATISGPTCAQNVSMIEQMDKELYDMAFKSLMDNMSEDCLIMDIFVPEGLPEKSPVLFWIHGGGFTLGSPSFNGFTDGDILAKNTSSLVISIQYRLNVFGFMPIDHPDYPANLGLLDQTLALKWVQNNAHYFNGDKDSVTIFGESAGGMSVFAHMQSSLANGLFHKAIPQSGFPGVIMPTVAEGEASATKPIANAAGCPVEDQKEMIACLEGLSTEALLAVYMTVHLPLVLDGRVFERQPRDSYKNGLFNKVPLMVTLTSDDGNIFIEMIQGRKVVQEGISPEALETIITAMLMAGVRIPYNEIEFYKALAKYEYDLENSDKAKQLRNTYDFCRDAFFAGLPLYVAEVYSKAGVPVYVSVMDQPMRPNKGLIEVGAGHGDDMLYMFGGIYKGVLDEWADKPEITDEHKALTDNVMKTLSDFSRGNDLLIKWKGEQIQWPKFTSDDKKYMWWNVDMSPESVRSNPYERAVKFWSDLIPTLMEIGSPCSNMKGNEEEPQLMDLFMKREEDNTQNEKTEL